MNTWNFESGELIVAFLRDKLTCQVRGVVYAVTAEVKIMECLFIAFPTSECIQSEELFGCKCLERVRKILGLMLAFVQGNTVGQRFTSPIKRGLGAERAKQREEQKQVRVQEGNVLHLSPQLHYQDQAHLLNSLTPIFKSMSFRVSSVVDAPSQSRIPLY